MWKRWTFAKVFLIALVGFNLNMRPIPSGDTAPTALLPVAIVLDGRVTLERFEPFYERQFPGQAYWLHRAHDRVWSSYPIAPALLVAPLYTPLLAFPGLRTWDARELILLARILEKLAASLLAAVSVGLFFLLAREFVRETRAAAFALIFAFATPMWSIASQALWQHTPSVLLITLSLYLLARNHIPGAAIAAALGPAMRPTDVLFVLASMSVLAMDPKVRWKALLWYGLSTAIIGTAVVGYNLHVFGRPTGMYAQPFDSPALQTLAGLLFSPARGLFIYSPVLLFAFARRPQGRIAWISAIFIVAQLAVYSKWPNWWGGACWGPRLLTDIVPCLMLLLLPVRVGPAFLALTTVSIAMHAIGVFWYPNGRWDSKPIPIDSQPQRAWDIRDNPVARTLGAGFNVDGYVHLKELVEAWLQHRPPRLDDLPIARSAPTASSRRRLPM